MAEKIFYKYKSCAGDIGSTNTPYAYLLDTLKNKYFYLTRPELLNDPMDCKCYDNFYASIDDMKKWLSEVGREYLAEKIDVYELKRRSKQNDFQNDMRKGNERERQHLHIFSVTDSYDSIEMWNKYADNYTGVCLGYKAVQVNPPYPTYFFEILPNQHLPIVGGAYPVNGKEYVHLMKVKYDHKNRIDYKLFRSWDKNERNKLAEAFLHKNKERWSYENESRVIVFDFVPRNRGTIDVLVHYPDYVLSEVYLGHNIDSVKKQEILNTLKQYYSNFNTINIQTI